MKKFLKRISTICFIFFAVSFNAAALDDQKISTFEPGATGEVGFSGYTVNYTSSFSLQPAAATNTLTTGINGSANCFSMTTATTAIRWKTLSYMTLASSITPAMMTDRRYLKIMVYRNYDGNNLRILANGTGANYTDANYTLYAGKPTKNVWTDIVIDLKALKGTTDWSIQTINNLQIQPIENNSTPGLGYTVTVALDNIVLSDNSTPRSPTITTSATNVYSHSYIYGAGPSSEKSFTVSGVTLMGDITLTPTAPYEISTTSGSGFTASALTLTPSSGSVPSTTIYTRLKAGLSYAVYDTKNVVITTSGGTTKNVALWGWVNKKALTISEATIASKIYDDNTTSGTVTSGALSGFIGAETVTVSTATGTYPDANVGTGKTATIVYTLANGTNGGLAANYSLANGTATGDITAATGSPTGNDLTNSGLTDNQLANTNLTVSSGEFTINDTKTVRSLTVAPGAKLTYSSGSLNATNGITLESDATGTATFMDSNNEPTITATVQQYLPQGRNWYTASPIETNIATATNLSAAGASSVSYYNETSGWVNDYTGTLVEGVGYIAVSSAGTSTNKINITGKLNTGDVPVTLTNSPSAGKGFNLVGNPYPSYLSWSAVAADNAAANMPSGTMWYRTTNYNGKSAWAASTVYNQNDIVYNGTRFYKATSVTGTSAASGGPSGSTTGITDGTVVWNYEGSIYIFATVNASGVVAPVTSTVSNLVPPMQAFWVKSTGGTMTFKNTMRSHNTGGTNALKAPKSTASDLKLIRLNVSNGASADEAVIYASANANNAFDTYDAPKYFNTATSNQPEIYTQVGNEKLVINAMSEITEGTEIPLGFATEKGNNFSISATEFSNFGSNTKVMLKDKQTSSEFDLTAGQSYEFSSSVVNSTDRFSLVFRAPGVTTALDNIKLNAQVYVNAANQIAIIAPEKSNYTICNAMGQLIENGILNTKHQTIYTKLNAGVYVVKVNNQSTKVIVK